MRRATIFTRGDKRTTRRHDHAQYSRDELHDGLPVGVATQRGPCVHARHTAGATRKRALHLPKPDGMRCGRRSRRNRLDSPPQLLLDVSYPETEDDDRSRKFRQYRQLPSLQHHVIVSQATMLVEYFRRNEADQWIITVLTEPEEVLVIPELNLRLTVAEIYDETCVVPTRITFKAKEKRILIAFILNNYLIPTCTIELPIFIDAPCPNIISTLF